MIAKRLGCVAAGALFLWTLRSLYDIMTPYSQ